MFSGDRHPRFCPRALKWRCLRATLVNPGPFTARLKTPAGYKIPAHQHPTAEAVTVISGEFNFGMGDKLDEAKAQKLGPGGFVDLPANMNHFAFATSESVVQLSSEGPFSIKYVTPADDPSKSQ